MSILSRVWGGPFKTPPLTHPITVGWVLLKVLETLWRALLLLIIGVALIAGYLWLSQEKALDSQVHVEVAQPSQFCTDPTRPIYVRLTNNSNVTIGEVDVRFRVYAAGKSEDLAMLGSTSELHDILRPGYWESYCFAMPSLEAGSAGPFSVAADITSATKLSKDVPVPPPPPVIQVTASTSQTLTARRPWWDQLETAIGAMMALALFGSGGFGLMILGDRVFGFKNVQRIKIEDPSERAGCLLLMGMAFLDALLVTLASYGLSAVGAGGWINGVDSWSRSHGFADGGMMLLGGSSVSGRGSRCLR